MLGSILRDAPSIFVLSITMYSKDADDWRPKIPHRPDEPNANEEDPEGRYVKRERDAECVPAKLDTD